MDLSALLAAINQSEKEIESNNPYRPFEAGITGIKWDPSGYSTKENVVATGVQGLLAGLFGGLGDDYATEQKGKVYNALDNYLIKKQPIDTTEIDPEVFAPVEKVGKLFAIQDSLDAQDAVKQAESELVKKIREKQLDRGIAIDKQGNEIKIFDPVKDEEDKAAALAKGKISGENAAWGGAELNPDNPKNKESKQKLDAFDTLRKEFQATQSFKDYEVSSKGAQALAQALKDNGAVADQELVRRTIQMIEPGMAVREGEAAAVAGSQGLSDQYKGEMLKALRGESALASQTREGIKRLAQRAYAGHLTNYEKSLNYYQGLAKGRELGDEGISSMGAPMSLKDIGLDSEKPPTPPPGYALTGKRDANGKWGVKKIK